MKYGIFKIKFNLILDLCIIYLDKQIQKAIHTTMINLSKLIKDAREQKKLTQTELGSLVGCTWDHISKIERGIKKPSPKIFEKILNILSLSIPENIKTIINHDTQYKSDLLQIIFKHLPYLDEKDASIVHNLVEILALKNKAISKK